MNYQYVEQALCFHGAPMQKIWDNERGIEDLQRLGVPAQLSYTIYQQRQRFFTFQDRAKRLKLHQFLARKANDLYDKELKKYANIPDEKQIEKVATSYVTTPPYETYVTDPNDKDRKWRSIIESLKPGDIVYGIVTKTLTPAGLVVKPLCTMPPLVRFLNHLPVKGVVQCRDIGTLPLGENGQARGYIPNDFVRCEVVRASIEVFLGFEGVHKKDRNAVLGLVENRDSLPRYYHKATQWATESYEKCLKDSQEFLNPNYEVLYRMNGLDINDTFSLMGALKRPFPSNEMAKDLRKEQAHKWAFRSVANGIEFFKNGKHFEAFQCLNKALGIDAYNVEGLVARGALFANRGSFHKAIEDFTNALKLDEFHANARKYLGETMVALGRSLEEENRLDEAAKAYKDSLQLIPNHVQAINCLEALNQRLTGSLLNSAFFDNLKIPGLTKPSNVDNKSSSNEDSSSESEDSSDSVPHANSAVKARSKLSRASSLSPLSKRLAMHAAALRGGPVASAKSTSLIDGSVPKNLGTSYDQPFYVSGGVADANDFRLDDDDTQARVLKLLEEASAHKKEKKKKSKKSKKSKKEHPKKSKNNGKTFVDDDNDEVKTVDLGQSLFQRNYLLETYKNIGNDNFQQKICNDINSYEHKIAELRKREELIRQSLTTTEPTAIRDGSPAPPPPPLISLAQTENDSKFNKKPLDILPNKLSMIPSTSSYLANAGEDGANKLSFQIRRPVKVDKFGLVRIATPLTQRSPSASRDLDETRRQSRRSRTRSPYSDRGRRRRSTRSRSRTRGSRSRRSRSRRSRSRSRSRRSRSSSYERRRRNRRRSRSRYRSRRYSRDSRSRRRDSRSRSHSYAHKKGDDHRQRTKFANRVWQRPGYGQPEKPNISDPKWEHDKFEEINSEKPIVTKEEGPSIEEIDEIINKAQKERKAEIISRDKDILKKPTNARF